MNNRIITSNAKLKGWTETRLLDGKLFREILVKQGVKPSYDKKYKFNINYLFRKGLESGLSEEYLSNALNDCAKPLFNVNFLWKAFHKLFGLDLQIPLLFGYWTTQPIKRNTITSVGKQISAQQTGGTTSTPVTAIAIGVGSPSATALGSESTTNGGSRGAATVSNQTTTTTGDTERWVKTFTFSGSLALTEEGLFDNNASAGNMLASQSFSAINVVNTDTLQITHNVKYA